jgi:hypothetical protein
MYIVLVGVVSFRNFMLSILTCGRFLHQFPYLGYRKINFLNTSSIPLDDTPTTPKWPRDLVPRPPSMLHIILFRHWSRSWKSLTPIFPLQDGFWEPRELPPTGAFISLLRCWFCFLLILCHFDNLYGFLVRQNSDCMPRHTFACCVYWRCLVTIPWLSACNIIPTCTAFVYGAFFIINPPSYRHPAPLF